MKTFSRTGSRTRAAWVKTRNPNRWTIWEFDKISLISQFFDLIDVAGQQPRTHDFFLEIEKDRCF